MPQSKNPALKPQLVVLTGPTAVGKTAVSIALAEKINAEVISCDSMQIYKGMDIITSKPGLKERKKVAHHLLDIVSPEKDYDVALFRKEALKKIKEVIKRKNTPLLVGGTGLYISMLVDGLFTVKAQDKSIREKLYLQLGQKGSVYLYKKLESVDKDAALKIHPNDAKRIIRALEVYEVTGKPISKLWKKRKGLASEYDLRMFCLVIPRERLYRRIDARVEEMFASGLFDEIKKLLKLNLSRTASCAIGIREMGAYLRNESTLDEAKALMQKNTRNYAKRQLTWFRKDKRLQWVEVFQGDTPAKIAGRIIKMLKKRHG